MSGDGRGRYEPPGYGTSMHFPHCQDRDCIGCLPPLPLGFVPAWEWIRTEDGSVEYEHEAGRIVREALEAQDEPRS